MAVRVLIADDQALVRQGIALLLAGRSEIEVVGEADTGLAALDVARRVHPDVALVDLRMPVMDGVEATRHLAGSVRVIVLTTFEDETAVLDALNAGARGFLLKDVSPDALVEAILAVSAGGAVLAPSVAGTILDRFASRFSLAAADPGARLDGLSERETEVLRLLGQGLSNREIADALVLTELTVKSHISHILLKLDVRDRTQAVIAAYDSGLIRPGAIRPAPAG